MHVALHIVSIAAGPSPSFITINGKPWKAQIARKPRDCAVSGERIAVGDTVFAPMGNWSDRMLRIQAHVLRQRYPAVFRTRRER